MIDNGTLVIVGTTACNLIICLGAIWSNYRVVKRTLDALVEPVRETVSLREREHEQMPIHTGNGHSRYDTDRVEGLGIAGIQGAMR
jgi:hypothetical protein